MPKSNPSYNGFFVTIRPRPENLPSLEEVLYRVKSLGKLYLIAGENGDNEKMDVSWHEKEPNHYHFVIWLDNNHKRQTYAVKKTMKNTWGWNNITEEEWKNIQVHGLDLNWELYYIGYCQKEKGPIETTIEKDLLLKGWEAYLKEIAAEELRNEMAAKAIAVKVKPYTGWGVNRIATEFENYVRGKEAKVDRTNLQKHWRVFLVECKKEKKILFSSLVRIEGKMEAFYLTCFPELYLHTGDIEEEEEYPLQ